VSQETFHDVERALFSAWGGSVRLGLLERMEEHEHVARLAVQHAIPGAPQTVILKRWRSPGDDRFDRMPPAATCSTTGLGCPSFTRSLAGPLRPHGSMRAMQRQGSLSSRTCRA